jgi:phenylalanyl-tRNA synthetase beta chain
MKFSYFLIKKLLLSAHRPEKSGGQMKLPSKARLIEALNMHSFETADARGDAVEISLPANRWSDAASHFGIARESAAIFGFKLGNYTERIVNPPEDRGFLEVNILDKKDCPRYAARLFEIKKISSSPRWLQNVLKTCGVNPINDVVDLMNYVMLEIGQPLHAFDAEKLKSSKKGVWQIIVRRAKNGEKIETLDGQRFAVGRNVLVIADAQNPLAIAGIKGGASSGVSRSTRRIIVEAANFNPVLIYKASRELKLATDASLRFSHGLSPALVDFGLDRVTELLVENGAKLLDSVDIASWRGTEEVIEFSCAKYENVVGAPVKIDKAKRYFELLGFGVDKSKRDNSFFVRIPPWRTDLEEPEDLIEEIARLENYNKFLPAPPVVSIKPAHEEDVIVLKDKVRTALVNFQFDEVCNSSFLGDADFKEAEKAGLRPEFWGRTAYVLNPVAEDKKYLRPSLLPLLLKNAESNSRFFDAVRIFEIGKVFNRKAGGVGEKLSLGVVLAAKKEPRLILEIKGVADDLLKSLGVDDFSLVPSGDTLRVEVDHRVLGAMYPVRMERGWTAAFGEFDLDKILDFTEEEKEYVPLKRFPAVMRDISILVSRDVRIGDVLQEIQDVGPELIENVDLIDEYVDEKMGGKQSLTFRIIFQAEDRTLTDEEVNAEIKKITSALAKNFRAEVR